MGEKINFDDYKKNNPESTKEPLSKDNIDKPADIIDFKERLEKKKGSIQLKEEGENILKESHKNKDGTYEIRFNLKLKNNKRETLTDYLISKGLHFYSVDNKMGPTESDIGLDLDIEEDGIQNLLAFLKEKDIEYTHIE